MLRESCDDDELARYTLGFGLRKLASRKLLVAMCGGQLGIESMAWRRRILSIAVVDKDTEGDYIDRVDLSMIKLVNCCSVTLYSATGIELT